MTTTEPRVIGRRRNPARRVTFTLIAYDGDKEHEYSLTARANMDTGSVFDLGDEKATPGQKLGAMRRLLSRNLVDDDGVSAHAVPRRVQEVPQDDTDDTKRSPSTELALVEDDASLAELNETVWRLGVHDDESDSWAWSDDSYPSSSLAQQAADSKPSSLRRFAWLIDHPVLAVDPDALGELVDVIVSESADRPTEPSTASPRSSRRRQR